MTSYISCGCNCQSNAVDWAETGLICYGYSNGIAIYNPDTHIIGKVLETYHKHSSQVKVVQWIDNDNNNFNTEILSGSLDGTIIVWSKKENDNAYSPRVELTIGDSLTTTHAIYLKKTNEDSCFRNLIICASSFKNIFQIWHIDPVGSIQNKQILNLKNRIPTEARMAHLPGFQNIPIVIIALDDATIHLFAWNNFNNDTELNFVHIKELRGHQGWIQCMDFAQINENEALLASGSQDGTIRLWKINNLIDNNHVDDERMNKFTIGDNYFGISLESVLSGHEHWVYGLHWSPVVTGKDGENKRPLKLLSCALDKTIIIWEPNFNGVWVETVRLGRVGGNSLGYYGCKFNKDGSSVVAHGYQGTFHMWKYNEHVNKWLPRSAPSGHFSDVTDLHWEPTGKYLLTTSSDQTTRIHIPWRDDHKSQDDEVWHEIARPQIHGYDINCLSVLSSTMFASGADEKVIRIFQAPQYFIESLNNDEWLNPKKITDSASVPTLGLTNKTHNNNELQENFDDNNLQCDLPPTEEEIIRYTLWPELEKLYGHGYEIFSMSARHDGKLLASASKSNSAEHSSIILWSTKTWAQVQKLSYHRLTVTQIAFSPDDEFLVSVSRDRRWTLYRCVKNDTDNIINYNFVGMSSKDNPLHARIIWCCAWAHDSKYFATGSRDGKIGIWSIDNQGNSNEIKLITSLDVKDASVTALAFSHEFLSSNTYVLAIGFDDGIIEIQKIVFNNTEIKWITCDKFDTSRAHHKTVKKLAFRPSSQKNLLYLASCSSDCSTKIHKFNPSNL